MRALVLASLVAVFTIGCASERDDEGGNDEEVAVQSDALSAATKCQSFSGGDQKPRASAGQLRTLTYNIRLGAADAEVEDAAGKMVYRTFIEDATTVDGVCSHLRAIARVIRYENPDTVVLNEIDVGISRTKALNEVAELAKMLDMPSSAFAFQTRTDEFAEQARSADAATRAKAAGKGSGMALLSRLPFARPPQVRRTNPVSSADQSAWALDGVSLDHVKDSKGRVGPYYNLAKRNVVLYADVATSAGVVRVAAVHTEASTHIEKRGSSTRMQEYQASRIDVLLGLDNAPVAVVVMGDMNITADAPRAPSERVAYCHLLGGTPSGAGCAAPTRTDAWRAAPKRGGDLSGATHMVTGKARFDYVLASSALTPLYAEVVSTHARTYKLSDHAPVVVTFEIN